MPRAARMTSGCTSPRATINDFVSDGSKLRAINHIATPLGNRQWLNGCVRCRTAGSSSIGLLDWWCLGHHRGEATRAHFRRTTLKFLFSHPNRMTCAVPTAQVYLVRRCSRPLRKARSCCWNRASPRCRISSGSNSCSSSSDTL